MADAFARVVAGRGSGNSDLLAARMAARALSFRQLNLDDPLKLMSSPPTVTVGAHNAVSAITAQANGTMSIGPTDARIAYAGANMTVAATGYQGPAQNQRHYRVRFSHFGRRFEFRMRGSTRPAFSIRVNDELVSTAWVSGVDASGAGNQLVLVDFGANTETAAIVGATIANGGSGYVVNEVITLAGGTGTAAKLRVAAVSGGAITSVRIEEQGSYSAAPANAVAQASTTGSGTGATFNCTKGYDETTNKLRFVEIEFGRDVLFGGLNVDANDVVQPLAVPAATPSRAWIGDSFMDSQYYNVPAQNYARQAARMLRDCDDWLFGIAGLGWLNGGGNQFSAFQANILTVLRERNVIVLGTNDNGANAATLQAAVTAGANAMLDAKPAAIFTFVAGWSGLGATEAAAIQAGVLAAKDQRRVRFVDMTGRLASINPHKTSDSTHPFLNGQAACARWMAASVGDAEMSMLTQLTR